MTAEALQAVPAEDKGVKVALITDLGEVTVTVPPPGGWKARANTAIAQGDMLSWSMLVLSEKDHEAVLNLDPTIDDFNEFFRAWKSEMVKRSKPTAKRRTRR